MDIYKSTCTLILKLCFSHADIHYSLHVLEQDQHACSHVGHLPQVLDGRLNMPVTREQHISKHTSAFVNIPHSSECSIFFLNIIEMLNSSGCV